MPNCFLNQKKERYLKAQDSAYLMTKIAQLYLEESWKNLLLALFGKAYMSEIKQFILDCKSKGEIIFPPANQIFNAFNLTPVAKTKVVIIGQDPYHGEGQAHGLSFSVPLGIKPPPSLKNIYKELQTDVDFKPPEHGNLSAWSKEGVLLLNAILTVNKGQPASHRKAGWEAFTDDVIQTLSHQKEHLVFMLWGNFAQSKAALIDENKHLILKAAHPSPFSAYNGFFGCKHFSKANEYLIRTNQTPINWQI